ncbi:LysR family transcriptional regulator, partial [Vibrio lentus]
VLDVSKGLVSRHVQRLEETLNSKLFHRTTRSISLTEVGEELYAKAKQIQLLATEAEMRVLDMTQEVAGDLKITAPIEFGRALCRHIIPTFKQEYPKVDLILDFG